MFEIYSTDPNYSESILFVDIEIEVLTNIEEVNDIIALQTKCLLEINSRDYTPQQIQSLIKEQKNITVV